MLFEENNCKVCSVCVRGTQAIAICVLYFSHREFHYGLQWTKHVLGGKSKVCGEKLKTVVYQVVSSPKAQMRTEPWLLCSFELIRLPPGEDQLEGARGALETCLVLRLVERARFLPRSSANLCIWYYSSSLRYLVLLFLFLRPHGG